MFYKIKPLIIKISSEVTTSFLVFNAFLTPLSHLFGKKNKGKILMSVVISLSFYGNFSFCHIPLKIRFLTLYSRWTSHFSNPIKAL